jgi:hypothetical protein
MTWRETLAELKEDLAEVRAERLQQATADEAEFQRQRDELSQLADSLGVSSLLTDINQTLLDDRGTIETIVSWESEEEDDDELLPTDGPGEEEEADVIALILSWAEGGERELAIDLGVTDQGIYVQVNGVEVRSEREALESALLQAFRDELEI